MTTHHTPAVTTDDIESALVDLTGLSNLTSRAIERQFGRSHAEVTGRKDFYYLIEDDVNGIMHGALKIDADLRDLKDLVERYLDGGPYVKAPTPTNGGDGQLISLCERCLAALAGYQAIFAQMSTTGIPYGKKTKAIEDAREKKVDAHWAANVAPLLDQIHKLPANTLLGFAYKAKVFRVAEVETEGPEDASEACTTMLDELAALVPEPARDAAVANAMREAA